MHHAEIYLHIVYCVAFLVAGGYLSYKYAAHVQSVAKAAAEKAVAEVKKL